LDGKSRENFLNFSFPFFDFSPFLQEYWEK